MKLYLANGIYVGTQAEAKKLDKNFTPVEVPTDKEGLIAYLNQYQVDRDLYHQYVEDAGDRVVKDINEDIDPSLRVAIPAQPGNARTQFYTDHTLSLDEAFANAPLAHRLTLACLALEDARDAIPAMTIKDNVAATAAVLEADFDKADQKYAAQVADDEVDPFA